MHPQLWTMNKFSTTGENIHLSKIYVESVVCDLGDSCKPSSIWISHQVALQADIALKVFAADSSYGQIIWHNTSKSLCGEDTVRIFPPWLLCLHGLVQIYLGAKYHMISTHQTHMIDHTISVMLENIQTVTSCIYGIANSPSMIIFHFCGRFECHNEKNDSYSSKLLFFFVLSSYTYLNPRRIKQSIL